MVAMRPTKDEYFLEMAELVAKRSTCLRRAVGCVLVSARGHVLATGYNGVASGLPHCNEPTRFSEVNNRVLYHRVPIFGNRCPSADAPSGTQLEGCQAIHAEQNALLQCQDVYEIDTVYVTVTPCITCQKLLLNTSARRIVATADYGHSMSLWTETAGRQLTIGDTKCD